MTVRLFKLSLLVPFLLLSPSAHSCSCVAFDLARSVGEAEYVYFAQVISAKVQSGQSSSDGKHVEAILQIGDVLKGKITVPTITVRTGLGGGDCGIPMVVPATYVVFANRDNNYIGMCSGTQPVDYFVPFEESDDLSKRIKNIVAAGAKRRP